MDARGKERMQSSSMCNSIQWSQNVYIHGKTPENYVEKWIEFYLLGSSDYVWFPAFAISFCIARIILTIRKKKNKNDSKGYCVSVFSSRWTMDNKMSRIQWSRSWDMEVKRPLLAWGESSNCEIYLPECGYASPSSLTFIGSLTIFPAPLELLYVFSHFIFSKTAWNSNFSYPLITKGETEIRYPTQTHPSSK